MLIATVIIVICCLNKRRGYKRKLSGNEELDVPLDTTNESRPASNTEVTTQDGGEQDGDEYLLPINPNNLVRKSI